VHLFRASKTSAVAVSSPKGVSSVIKTHFFFTSAYGGYPLFAIKIRSYTFFY
jgi:hypothetical protein